MATAVRASVMLLVFVGLPSAWVYYGPLPPAAMGVIQRTVASAKASIGWNESVNMRLDPSPITAPRFDGAVSQAIPPVDPRASQTMQHIALPSTGLPTSGTVRHDAKFSLASAIGPTSSQSTSSPTTAMAVEGELARQLEPHLSLLRSLGAAEYTLENWGGTGQLYRFRCGIALGDNNDHTRQFEAIDTDPLRAVHQIVGEVTSWQNTRLSEATSSWR